MLRTMLEFVYFWENLTHTEMLKLIVIGYSAVPIILGILLVLPYLLQA